MSKYINLRLYTDYSLGFGTIKAKDLAKYCADRKIPAIAITDKDNLFGSLEFSMELAKAGVQPIIGLDATVRFHPKINSKLLLIAKNQEGYNNLLKISSIGFANKNTHGEVYANWSDIQKYKNGLIVFSTGNQSYTHLMYSEQKITEAREHIALLNEEFKDHHYIEIDRTSFAKCCAYEDFILDIAYEHNIPFVGINPTAFLDSSMVNAQDALICIVGARYLMEENRLHANPQHYFKSDEQFSALYADIPEAVENTILIAKRCSVMALSRNPLLPKFSTDEDQELADQALAGLKHHIESITDETVRKKYFDRLNFELSVINKMQYAGYFLIVSDFIKWSKKQNIPVGPGRGSGAGSVVAWALEITDLDPLRFGLLFERFLNPERVSMPDFDIDFCQDRRQEVIEYVRQKYGDDKVAQIITFGKLQARAVLRDVGRVMQLPYGVIDRICKMVPNNPAHPVTLKEAISLDKELQKTAETDPDINRLLKISLQLEGMNRHASTHAAGIVIADRPIVELVPLYNDGTSEMSAVQYSMKYAEAAGLVKFDFLGLKTLTVISWASELICKKNPGFNISKVPLDDELTYKLLARGETIGVFQFESAGMKEAIKKLRPDAIEDLIALGSLYRPGPMDNIPSYINRKHGLENPEYLHPLMEVSLKETYGIIVYQEQVMQIAQILAGYTLGGADLLRRAMGKKIKAEMEAQRSVFVNGCVENNIDKKLASEIFDLIEKFASYGFNKSHAAAYALISYQTAYLKANYPIEFLVASMNLEIDDTTKISTFTQEVKRLKIEILPPDINVSEAKFSIKDNKINYGLGALKNVGINLVQEIINERNTDGKFKDIYDFAERCGSLINKRIFESLIKSGALQDVHANRNELLSNCEFIIKYGASHKQNKNTTQMGLFSDFEDDIKPKLTAAPEWTFEEILAGEFEAFGFYLSKHPLESYELKLTKARITESSHVEMMASFKGSKLVLAGVVTSKKIRSSPRGKYAFIQISDRSGVIELSLFNEQILTQKEHLIEPGSLITVRVDARKDDNGLKIIIENIEPINDGLKHVNTSLEVTITDPSVTDSIKRLISMEPIGKPLKLSLELETGEKIMFRSKSQLYIDTESEMQLRKMAGVKIWEY